MMAQQERETSRTTKFIPQDVDHDERAFYIDLLTFLTHKNKLPTSIPIWNKKPLDFYNLYKEVILLGGYSVVNGAKARNPGQGLWSSVGRKIKNASSKNTDRLCTFYQKYLLDYERASIDQQPPKKRRRVVQLHSDDDDSVVATATSMNSIMKARLSGLIDLEQYDQCKSLCLSCYNETEFVLMTQMMRDCVKLQNPQTLWEELEGEEFLKNVCTVLGAK
jgi:hypothetical protein